MLATLEIFPNICETTRMSFLRKQESRKMSAKQILAFAGTTR